MLAPLLLGSAITALNMIIQVAALVVVIGYLTYKRKRATGDPDGRLVTDTRILGTVLLVLFAGHIVQFAVWATVFVALGEFGDFDTAFYHSAVNFAALGYGDIVMSPRWRLLGAIEAANGVLMFSLSAASVYTVMHRLLASRGAHEGHQPPNRP